ncbi:MAG TPA: hypothetical protein VME69_17070 [Methylocella sp.]|nr:hypothetical protein [Methylocella sp.]
MSHEERVQRVREILLMDWDPLIVGDNPHLTDEYDDLIPDILHLLDAQCTAKQLAQHLASIDARWGGQPSWQNIERAVRELLAIGRE